MTTTANKTQTTNQPAGMSGLEGCLVVSLIDGSVVVDHRGDATNEPSERIPARPAFVAPMVSAQGSVEDMLRNLGVL